jgi:predicted ATPase
MFGLARATQDPKQLIVAHWVMVQASEDYLRAREHAEEGIRLYDPQDYRSSEYPYTQCDPGVFLLVNLSGVLLALGYPDQALARTRQAQALARERSDPATQAHVVLWAPGIHLGRGEYRAALDAAESTMALAREHGLQFQLGIGAWWRAQVLARLGQFAEGWAGLIAVQSETIANPPARAVPMAVNWAARALGEVGQADVGLDELAKAEVLMESTGARSGEAELYDIRGNLFLALPTPDPAQAEVAFRKALEVARRQSGKSWELRAATSLAGLWQGQGRNEEARDLLQPVYEWFTEGFDTKDLKDAKALLEELGS